MTDPTTGGGPDPEAQEPRCPWCSTALPAGSETCPNCGAAVTPAAHAADDAAIPGVTSVDPITAARKPINRPNRIVSWLAGDLDPLPDPDPLLALGMAPSAASTPALGGAGPDSYAPPSAEVRREMARLELEAIKAELEASAPEAEPPGTTPEPPPAAAADPTGDGSATGSSDEGGHPA